MSTADDSDMLVCAACGKDGDALKTCTACKLVKYCDASCQRAHRSKHKKECKKRAADLHDEALFKEPPPRDECPICMLPLPKNPKEQKYQPCCGKVLCYGCIHEVYKADNRGLCPFCRTSEVASEEECMERIKKRVDGGDAIAMRQLGCYYQDGIRGLPQDYEKAMELWLRAGKLGSAAAYCKVADAYYHAEGVERDVKKANYYDELAAMGGVAKARHNLGVLDNNVGNVERAMKHLMISAGAGHDESLTAIQGCFLHGHATKEDFDKALRSHKAANDEMKSDQRETAAAHLKRFGRL